MNYLAEELIVQPLGNLAPGDFYSIVGHGDNQPLGGFIVAARQEGATRRVELFQGVWTSGPTVQEGHGPVIEVIKHPQRGLRHIKLTGDEWTVAVDPTLTGTLLIGTEDVYMLVHSPNHHQLMISLKTWKTHEYDALAYRTAYAVWQLQEVDQNGEVRVLLGRRE